MSPPSPGPCDIPCSQKPTLAAVSDTTRVAATIDGMNIGDEWIYRLKVYSPSERVKILAIEKRKQSTRVDIEFLDGEHAGLLDSVPATRPHGPWITVTQFDERMANWQRLGGSDLDETEESAVGEVFDALIPESIATYYDSFVRNGATVRDREALERLMRRPMSEVLDQVEWFEADGLLELSADGTLLIAEYVCAKDPVPVIERVMAEEAGIREHCKRGRDTTPLTAPASKLPHRNGSTSGTASITVRFTNCSAVVRASVGDVRGTPQRGGVGGAPAGHSRGRTR